ncbi:MULTISPECIES: DUF4403 family protein [Sphingomonas]|uniref:DUF4403 family protein n=1 Tax=Sphingomonas TaxID=13687 RepID=UPI000DEFFC01|nr:MULTISPECIES: DUF4403 family protein [Sphingomonas]
MRANLRVGVALVLAVAASSCGKQPAEAPLEAPPRLTTPAVLPQTTSAFTVPIQLPTAVLRAALERSAPRQLWSIDERRPKCVPAQRLKLFGRRLKVTPDLSCRIVGQVTRGAISIAGQGERLTISLPVFARISARDVGGVLKGETATGSAVVRAAVRLALGADWRPRATVALSYDWREPPGIDFLGQRIKFVGRADRELAKVIGGLERDLQREIAKAPVKPLVAQAWREGFTVIELNRDKPPAYMRITPKTLGLASYAVDSRSVQLLIGGTALTETTVGAERPAPPVLTPLPPASKVAPDSRGLSFTAAVLADPRQLEPVVLRALQKLNAKGIKLDKLGPIEALFDKVTIYPTSNGRLAVGIDVRARRLDPAARMLDMKSQGTVWLTGKPVNDNDSQVVRVEDLAIFGRTDNRLTNLALPLVQRPDIMAAITAALTQDFTKDYDKVLTSARKAIADRPLGKFRLQATIDQVHHGQLVVTGSGLLLPVSARGTARLQLAR